MLPVEKPSRDAFIAYWKDYGRFGWRVLLWYGGYLGGLALLVLGVRSLDPEGRWLIASLALAIAYLVLLPYLTIRRVHSRYARFIRCPCCGDWFAQDASGMYHGANPTFQTVIETGRCVNCGAQIFGDT